MFKIYMYLIYFHNFDESNDTSQVKIACQQNIYTYTKI